MMLSLAVSLFRDCFMHVLSSAQCVGFHVGVMGAVLLRRSLVFFFFWHVPIFLPCVSYRFASDKLPICLFQAFFR